MFCRATVVTAVTTVAQNDWIIIRPDVLIILHGQMR